MRNRRFAIVGTGARVTMFLDPLVSRFRDSAEVVALCDRSPTRMRYHLDRISQEYQAPPIALYPADEFEEMLRREKPDCVIVCTPDAFHHEYIIRALNAGLDVISEKPLTTDEAKCRAIFDAAERSKGTIRTTFNCRWIPGPAKVKEVIASGVIGKIKHLQMNYMLGMQHGADYFRRWHSEKSISGGLLVHKSTHHFDLINWWCDAIPERVFAMGDLFYFGRTNAVSRGREAWTHYERYTGQNVPVDDPFRIDLIEDQRLKRLYLDAESEGGYVRDRNVFRDGIDIEDAMDVVIRYRGGELASYSLNAFSPIEGMDVAITGTEGRIEYRERKPARLNDGVVEVYEMGLTVIPQGTRGYTVPIESRTGGHGGSDVLLQEHLFGSAPPPDDLRRYAGHEQGAASLLIGAAANHSIATGGAVSISSLLPLQQKAVHLHDLI